ncbi:MAG: hypothetical protein HFG77_13130 [Hungatella sp.]|jgi:hypothetical protein|nr:hypothetical protein [Hungatella sp.]
MGRKLKTMVLNGTEVKEAGCMDYVCRYCGGKATALNFVADMCLQVYAKHNGLCGAYTDSEKYRGYVTDCSTCARQKEGECVLD